MVYDPEAGARHIFLALDNLRRRSERDISRLIAASSAGFRGSHGRILSFIPDEGIRPSEIAADAWITKQAVGDRLREMEKLGWVKTIPDPQDGRALIVHRTAAGTRVRTRARQAIARMEREWAEAVGPDRYKVFRAVIDELGVDPE